MGRSSPSRTSPHLRGGLAAYSGGLAAAQLVRNHAPLAEPGGLARLELASAGMELDRADRDAGAIKLGDMTDTTRTAGRVINNPVSGGGRGGAGRRWVPRRMSSGPIRQAVVGWQGQGLVAQREAAMQGRTRIDAAWRAALRGDQVQRKSQVSRTLTKVRNYNAFHRVVT